MKLLGKLEPYKAGVDLYRLDQLPFGGGNKVPRFIEFFLKNPKINTLVAMSDMGAHTFSALLNFYDQQDHLSYQLKKMIYLENRLPMTDYQRAIRNKYLSHPGVKIYSGPTWKMFLYYACFKWFSGYTLLGIGGHVKIKATFFNELFMDCVTKIDNATIVHILPVSSGDMLLAFLKAADEENHRFIGIMTGNPVSRILLKFKFRDYDHVKLVTPREIDEEKYTQLGTEFYEKTGIAIDPIHSVQSVYLADHYRWTSGEHVVVWITQPDTQYFTK